MDKKILFRKLNEHLALEQAIIEAEGIVSGRTTSPDLQQALNNAIREDEAHQTMLRRMVVDLGGKVTPPAMDTLAWIEALLRNISTSDDELDRLGLLRMLKAGAIASGELFDRLRFVLGNPPEMEPLVPILRQDRDHAGRLAEVEGRMSSLELIL